MVAEAADKSDSLLDLTSKVYKLVVERGKNGVLQSELWKVLGLTSRDGSRLAIRLEKRGMVSREKTLDGGRWTYKLSPVRLPVQIKPISRSPCITCAYETRCAPQGLISPQICLRLSEWILREFEEAQSAS